MKLEVTVPLGKTRTLLKWQFLPSGTVAAHLHLTREQLDTEEGQRRDEEADTVEDLPEAGDAQTQGRGGAGPVKQPASGGEEQHAQGGQTRQQPVL